MAVKLRNAFGEGGNDAKAVRKKKRLDKEENQ